MASFLDGIAEALFGKRETLTERLEREKRDILTCRNGLEREKRRIEREEGRIEERIRERAARGKMREVRMLAKQIVMNDKACAQLTQTAMRLSTVAQQLGMVQSQQAMARAIGTAAMAMRARRMRMPGGMQRVLQAYQFEQMQAETASELFDDMMEDEEDEEEEEELVQGVLDRLHIEMAENLDGVVVGQAPGGRAARESEQALQERMNRLNGGGGDST